MLFTFMSVMSSKRLLSVQVTNLKPAKCYLHRVAHTLLHCIMFFRTRSLSTHWLSFKQVRVFEIWDCRCDIWFEVNNMLLLRTLNYLHMATVAWNTLLPKSIISVSQVARFFHIYHDYILLYFHLTMFQYNCGCNCKQAGYW